MFAFILIIAIFWILMGDLFNYQEPELEYYNETEVTVVLDTIIQVDHNSYESVLLPGVKDDLINYTITVTKGGPIDYYILEERKRDTLIDALEGRTNRFDSYERGRGKNTTKGSSEFLLISNQDWYVFINNYGHVQNGARPSSEVFVHIYIEKIGKKTTVSFSIS